MQKTEILKISDMSLGNGSLTHRLLFLACKYVNDLYSARS